MEADELFDHALTSLPEAVGALLREGRDPHDVIFASFDGASELGMALIASDLAGDLDLGGDAAECEVAQMVHAANLRGEALVVSLMVSKEILARVLRASNVGAETRVAVALWLERPVTVGQFRVVAIAGDQVRTATVDGALDDDDAPISSSLLN